MWLEIKPSKIDNLTESIGSKILEVPALLEVFKIAAAAKHSSTSIWEYSRRLVASEVAQVKRIITFESKVEDERSMSLSANVTYKGSCYTLTLFAIKGRNQ